MNSSSVLQISTAKEAVRRNSFSPWWRAFAKRSEGESESWKIRNPVVKSWSAVDQNLHRWRLLVATPAQSVVEKGGSCSKWLISFSRYDYTHGENGPILSSSSPHVKLGFHRQQEWGITRVRQL